MTVTVDGIQRADLAIPLVDDRHEHSVEVTIPHEARTSEATLSAGDGSPSSGHTPAPAA